MAKRGSVRSEERRTYWQTAIELQRESTLSIRQFCKQEGLSEPSFYAWRRELARHAESSTTAAPKFVPVEITADHAAPLVIELASGTKLSVNEGCPPQLLKATLELLRC